MKTDRVGQTDIRFRRGGAGEFAVVFVHGFLDDQYVWDGVIEDLATPDVETVTLDLAGCGDRTDASGSFTLERLVSDVGAVVDALGKPMVLVGQSMAAPIVEMVAATRADRVLGLVLVTPIPLLGTQLPDEAMEPFRALSGAPEAQRAMRGQLSAALSDADLDRLVVVGSRMHPDVVRDLADCWNSGHPHGANPSSFDGPVLVVRGGDDGFVTDEMVAKGVLPRFRSAQTAVIDRAGHWVHVEQPTELATQLDVFLGKISTAANTAQELRGQKWTNAFEKKSAAAFGDAFAKDIVLEASALRQPIQGSGRVKQVMATASTIYEELVFTHEATHERRNYLEWEAKAFDGVLLKGVTVLDKDEAGQIIHVAIHHRPLDGLLKFSTELGQCLRGTIDSAHFFGDETGFS